MGKIKVKGSAAMDFAADTMELTFTVGTESASPVTAAEKGKAQTEALLSVLEELGIAPEEITLRSENVSEQHGYGGQQTVFRFSKEMTLKTKADLNLSEKVSAAIIAKEIPARYSVSFSLSDEKACGEKVIAAALADARAKAELIAAATGNKVTGLDSADFEYDNSTPTVGLMRSCYAADERSSAASRLTPDRITVSKEISVCWNAE